MISLISASVVISRFAFGGKASSAARVSSESADRLSGERVEPAAPISRSVFRCASGFGRVGRLFGTCIPTPETVRLVVCADRSVVTSGDLLNQIKGYGSYTVLHTSTSTSGVVGADLDEDDGVAGGVVVTIVTAASGSKLQSGHRLFLPRCASPSHLVTHAL